MDPPTQVSLVHVTTSERLFLWLTLPVADSLRCEELCSVWEHTLGSVTVFNGSDRTDMTHPDTGQCPKYCWSIKQHHIKKWLHTVDVESVLIPGHQFNMTSASDTIRTPFVSAPDATDRPLGPVKTIYTTKSAQECAVQSKPSFMDMSLVERRTSVSGKKPCLFRDRCTVVLLWGKIGKHWTNVLSLWEVQTNTGEGCSIIQFPI